MAEWEAWQRALAAQELAERVRNDPCPTFEDMRTLAQAVSVLAEIVSIKVAPTEELEKIAEDG